MKTIDAASRFEEFWKTGEWLKLGKKKAQRHFRASVKTEQDWREIQVARDQYGMHLMANDWKSPQQGGTWFNNWRDWCCWVEPKKVPKGFRIEGSRMDEPITPEMQAGIDELRARQR